MARVEVFLDQMPGEIRGVIARDGLYHHLIIHRDKDRPCDRLGARLVGRVVRVEPGLRGAFVDMGYGEPFGFLPMSQKDKLNEGCKLEVEVTSEPREAKGPVLKLLSAAEGEVRLIQSGPDVAQILSQLAPGVQPVTGKAAIRAAIEAEEDARQEVFTEASTGLDLAIQRTRALVSIDIDHRPAAGRDGRKAKEAVNWAGLRHSARLLSLKSLGGLVVIDMVGTSLHGETVLKSVRTAFAGHDNLGLGPLSRFGLLQISLPWTRRPIEDRLMGADGYDSQSTMVLAMVRSLRLRLLTDSTIARLSVHTHPDMAALAAPYIESLGPRAGLISDSGMFPGQFRIEEG